MFEKMYYININNKVEMIQFKHSEQNNNFDWTVAEHSTDQQQIYSEYIQIPNCCF